MERNIALFVASREKFFVEGTCINCSVDIYCACENASFLFDVDGVMRKKLVDVREGVKMSEPAKVEKSLIGGGNVHASLSHQGLLAIHFYGNIHFTNLNTNKQVEMKVENNSIAFTRWILRLNHKYLILGQHPVGPLLRLHPSSFAPLGNRLLYNVPVKPTVQ